MRQNVLKAKAPLAKGWMYSQSLVQVQEPKLEQRRLIQISGKPAIAVISDQSDSVSDWFASEFQGPDIEKEFSDSSDKESIIMKKVSNSRRVIKVPNVQ